MHGLLVVSGYRVQPAQLGLVQNVEIYGLLCKLLGIVARPNDGDDTLSVQVLRP